MEETSRIREGEEIDEESLRRFIVSELGVSGSPIEVRQFPAGSSNLTYFVRAGDRELVLRRPPFGNRVRTAHDMDREFRILTSLSAVYPPAPRPLAFCSDERVIGSEFYLMERKRGKIIRGEAPAEMRESPELSRSVCESFIRNLAELHSLDYEAAGLGGLGKPDGYAQRQVVGWSQRYFNAKTDEWEELEKSIFWLNNNIPDDDGSALVHNDYKFDNVILDPKDLTRVVGVLDWEMATVGSPLMDLGTTLGYWMDTEAGEEMLSMPFNPRFLMERVTRLELTQMYEEISGCPVPNAHYFYVFGTVKVAVIAQQIYFRFKKGFTSDTRFATFSHFVGRLGKIAWTAVGRGRL